jgi:regulatory protein
MKITAIERQKYNKEKVSVFLDGQYAFSLSDGLLLKFGLRKGVEVSEEDLVRFTHEKAFDEAKQAAFSFISYRMRSEAELKKKLKLKNFSPDVIDATAARLTELGLINDDVFAEALKHSKTKKKLGPARLRQELQKKGLSRTTIDDVMEKDETDYDLLAYDAAAKRMKSLAKEPDVQKAKKKLADFLMRRGFKWDVVKPVLAKFF